MNRKMFDFLKRNRQHKRIWKSAALVCLVAFFFTMNCFPQISSANLPVQKKMTNIVAVVDCSTSMEKSDSEWRVPEALNLLIDMCPDDQDIRFSLVVYGTESYIAVRDMPLTQKGKETIRSDIYGYIYGVGYKRGNTDTGAALMQAYDLLKGREEQNNRVLLFTDGMIRAQYNGRTTEISRSEVEDFVAFAQENHVVVDVFGLFNHVSKEEAATAENELKRLSIQSSGQYEKITDMSVLPDRMQTILSQALDVRTNALSEGKSITYNVGNKKKYPGWLYEFEITSGLQKDVTFVAPDPGSKVTAALLESPSGELYEAPSSIYTTTNEKALPGSSRVSFTRFTDEPGYCVVHMGRSGAPEWEGKWKLILLTDAKSVPVVNSYYLYDVEIHVEVSSIESSVMAPITVETYLTTSDGLRVDDLEFIRSLNATVSVINGTSQKAQELKTIEEIAEKSETPELVNDSFIYQFTPQFVSSYYFSVTLENDTLTRTAVTDLVQVQDDLVTVCNVRPSTIHKREPFTISGYLIQRSDGSRVPGDGDYYSYCDAYALITKTDEEPPVTQRVLLKALEDGSGFSSSCQLDEAGEYEVVIYTDNSQESLTQEQLEARIEEGVSTASFTIEDRPLQLIQGGFGKFFSIAGKSKQIDLSQYFYDPDDDLFFLSCTDGSGETLDVDMNGVLEYVGKQFGNQTLRVTATSYSSGETVEAEVEVMVLEIWQAILLLLGALLALSAIIAMIIFSLFSLYQRGTALRGMVKVGVTLNEWSSAHDAQRPQEQPRMQLGEFYFSMKDPDDITEERLDQRPKMLEKMQARRYSVSRLLLRFQQAYSGAGLQFDPSNDLLKQLLESEDMCEKMGYMVGQRGGKGFKLQKPRHTSGVTVDGKRQKQTVCMELDSRFTGGFVKNISRDITYEIKNLCITIEYLPENGKKGGRG